MGETDFTDFDVGFCCSGGRLNGGGSGVLTHCPNPPQKALGTLCAWCFSRRRSPCRRGGFYRGTVYLNVQDVLIGGWRFGIIKVHLLTRGWRKTVQRRSDDLHELFSSRWGDFPCSVPHFVWWTTCFVGGWQETGRANLMERWWTVSN